MNLKFFIFKDEIHKQPVYLEHISTDLMVADPLTKDLQPKTFKEHALRMRLGFIDN